MVTDRVKTEALIDLKAMDKALQNMKTRLEKIPVKENGPDSPEWEDLQALIDCGRLPITVFELANKIDRRFVYIEIYSDEKQDCLHFINTLHKFVQTLPERL